MITITVYGQPKPKGSLRSVGQGRMVEQLAGSKPWREAVKWAAIELCRGREPIEGPVSVEIVTTVPKPKSAPKTRRIWPVTRSSGDVDKHARNVLDALVDAAVMFDDSQVVRLVSVKCFPGEHTLALATPGAVIRVHPVAEPATPPTPGAVVRVTEEI